MGVLTRAVLAFESIVILLAIPVATRVDHRGAAAWVLVLLALLTLLATAVVKRRGGLAIGWGLQVLVLAGTFVVPALGLIGSVFVGLWAAALVVGRRGESVRATRLASWRRAEAQAQATAEQANDEMEQQ